MIQKKIQQQQQNDDFPALNEQRQQRIQEIILMVF